MTKGKSYREMVGDSFLHRDVSEETDEFILGVVDGYHEAGVASALGTVHTLEEVKDLLQKDSVRKKLPEDWNELQKESWSKGFLAGYEVRLDLLAKKEM